MNEQLFPARQSRREFLAAAGVAVGASLVTTRANADTAPTKLGTGKATYSLDATWGQLPETMKYGFGCAVVVDAKDRIFVTSRSASPCVAIFGPDGKLEETWGNEFATAVGFEKPEQVVATAHGLYHSVEDGKEFLYWTENVAGPKDAKIGARVYKTDIKGNVLYTLGNVKTESTTSQKFDFTNPTDVAVAPNGDIYIVDGYGSQLVHRFDKSFKLIKTMGGPGKEHGKFSTCHGVWISTIGKEPEVYIADRANGRIEIYSLELDYKRSIPGMKAPCCFYQHDGQIFIPELGGRVTIIDAKDQVVARLGENKGVKGADIAAHPEMFAAPHALTVDRKGNLYVIEWLPNARPRKFALAGA